MVETYELTLKTIGKSGVQELFQLELEKLLANIMDPNTKATAPRRLLLEFVITPYPDRSGMNIETKIQSKPAQFDATSLTCSAFIAKREGKFVAFTRDMRQELLFVDDDLPVDGKTAASGGE